MLWLVGTGISARLESIPKSGAEAISGADIVYMEQFTSPAPQEGGAVAAIQDIAPKGCAIRDAKRWMVEDGGQILGDAESMNVVLLSYGDPLVATTHTELLCRAANMGIETRVIHAASAPASIVGECGLHHYKVGRMATIMRDAKSMTTPYYTIYKNATESCHTLLLLEYDYEGSENGDGRSFFLEPADALSGLLKTEEGQRRNVICGDTLAIVASRIGLDDQHITAAKISSLIARGRFGMPPHSIIIPGRLHFTESDALAALAECVDPLPPHDGDADGDPNVPERIPVQMIAKYVPMIRESIKEAAALCPKEDEATQRILENAGLYASDAEDFVRREGHAEVAVLSIGYADGLVDALRMLNGLDAGSRGGGQVLDSRQAGAHRPPPNDNR